MTAPDASILIPTYARPGFLREALRSAVEQTHQAIEVLVGDDGDMAGDVVRELGDPRVRVLVHPARLGMAGNWTALLDAAEAPVVALLMDDDRLAPTFLERCLAVLAADPATGVAFTDHLFDRDGVRRARGCPLAGGPHDDFVATLLRDSPVAVSAAAFRRGLWERVRPLPDTAAADMVLFGRLAELGVRFHYVDEPLMIYRVHGANLSSDPAFRTDAVCAWRALRFSDPAAEALRRGREAEALVSRAALRIRCGELAGAREDLAAARALGGPGRRRRLLGAAVACPPLARGAVAAHALSGRVLRRARRSRA